MLASIYDLTLMLDPPPGGVRLGAVKDWERLVNDKPSTVLDYFLKLDTPARLKRFIAKYGPLSFCEHGNPKEECSCRGEAKQRALDRMVAGLPPLEEGDLLVAPIEFVRDYESLAKTFDDIIITAGIVSRYRKILDEGKRIAWERWVRIRFDKAPAMERLASWMQDYNGVTRSKLYPPALVVADYPSLPHLDKSMGPVIDYPPPKTEPQARQLVVDALERVSSWGDFSQRFDWGPPPNHPKLFPEPSDLWAVLGVGLARAVCGQQFTRCSNVECGTLFLVPTGQPGRPWEYCLACRTNRVPPLIAERRSRAKRKRAQPPERKK